MSDYVEIPGKDKVMWGGNTDVSSVSTPRARLSPNLSNVETDRVINVIQEQLSHSVLPTPTANGTEYEMMDSLVQLRGVLSDDGAETRISKVMKLDAAIGPNRLGWEVSPGKNRSSKTHTGSRVMRSKVVQMGASPLIMTSMSVVPTYTSIPAANGPKTSYERGIEKDLAFLDKLSSDESESESEDEPLASRNHHNFSRVQSFFGSTKLPSSPQSATNSEQDPSSMSLCMNDMVSPAQNEFSPVHSILASINSRPDIQGESPEHVILSSPHLGLSRTFSVVNSLKPSSPDLSPSRLDDSSHTADDELVEEDTQLEHWTETSQRVSYEASAEEHEASIHDDSSKSLLMHSSSLSPSQPDKALPPASSSTAPVASESSDRIEELSHSEISAKVDVKPATSTTSKAPSLLTSKPFLMTECPFSLEDIFSEHTSDTLVPHESTETIKNFTLVHDVLPDFCVQSAKENLASAADLPQQTAPLFIDTSSVDADCSIDTASESRFLSVVKNLDLSLERAAEDHEDQNQSTESMPILNYPQNDIVSCESQLESTPRESVIIPEDALQPSITTLPAAALDTSVAITIAVAETSSNSPPREEAPQLSTTSVSPAEPSPSAQVSQISDSVLKGLMLLGRVQQQMRKVPVSPRTPSSNTASRGFAITTEPPLTSSVHTDSAVTVSHPPPTPTTPSSVTSVATVSPAPARTSRPTLQSLPSSSIALAKPSFTPGKSSVRREQEVAKRTQKNMIGVFRLFANTQSQAQSPTAPKSPETTPTSQDAQQGPSPTILKSSLTVDVSSPVILKPSAQSEPLPLRTPWSPVMRRVPKALSRSPRVPSSAGSMASTSSSMHTLLDETPHTPLLSDTPSTRARMYRKPPLPKFSSPSSTRNSEDTPSSSSGILTSTPTSNRSGALSSPLPFRPLSRSFTSATSAPTSPSTPGRTPRKPPVPRFRTTSSATAASTTSASDASPSAANDSPEKPGRKRTETSVSQAAVSREAETGRRVSIVPCPESTVRHKPNFAQVNGERPVFVYQNIKDEHSAYAGNVLQRIRKISETYTRPSKAAESVSPTGRNRSISITNEVRQAATSICVPSTQAGASATYDSADNLVIALDAFLAGSPERETARPSLTSNLSPTTLKTPEKPAPASFPPSLRTSPTKSPSVAKQTLMNGPSLAPTPTRKPPVPVFRKNQQTSSENYALQPTRIPRPATALPASVRASARKV